MPGAHPRHLVLVATTRAPTTPFARDVSANTAPAARAQLSLVPPCGRATAPAPAASRPRLTIARPSPAPFPPARNHTARTVPGARPALRLVRPPLAPPERRRPLPLVRFAARLRSARGQSAVEFVAVLPLVLAMLAVVWQGLLAGEAVWAARAASRAAARENAFGGDAERAAREHLSAKHERGLRVRAKDDGDVTVTVRVPRVLPGIDPGHVSSTSHFRPQGA